MQFTEAQQARIAKRGKEMRKDCESAIDMMALLSGRRPRCTHDHEATAIWEELERVSRLTNELRNAVWERQDNKKPLTQDERMALMTVRATIANLLAL